MAKCFYGFCHQLVQRLVDVVRGFSELPFALLHALVEGLEVRRGGSLLQLRQVLDQRFRGLDLHKRGVRRVRRGCMGTQHG